MPDVITLGESMVLLTPDEPGPLKHVQTFSKRVGGAESNVAIALCRLGHTAGWISRLGRDPFGEFILSTIRGEGVDTTWVSFSDERPTGVMFKERLGWSGTNVYYYRTGSAASHLQPDDIPPDYLATAGFLHITGITPALSADALATVRHAVRVARQHGVQVCLDPNIRRKLWTPEEARETLCSLLQDVDICLPGQDEAELLTGHHRPEDQAAALMAAGPSCVVIKLEDKRVYYRSASDSGVVPAPKVHDVVDTVGAGDGFAAGFLSGLLDGLSLRDAVVRGSVVGAFALRSPGDFEGYPTRRELDGWFAGRREVER
ncbi:2-dehydro-3-deoxygluconokinase [Alicyclobacillus contaminans]|uniref:sugar kinase n=1 Tax=Alicyclobacillus contaminans TaxID=392016 RepID=UPI00040BE474|nr:sugar kinase [Alicyclobacillus contaminans]GMA51412.1 2-dehydro-3-deoxygluconokinase [Alicyclobacillus contaminans]